VVGLPVDDPACRSVFGDRQAGGFLGAVFCFGLASGMFGGVLNNHLHDILEAFLGARKQVFLTFAPYVLILTYGASTALMSSLYGLGSLVSIFLSPTVGRLMDRIGYTAVVVADGLASRSRS
jgi:hypothetical protein